MDSAKDISKKIRSAIKAKLVELGAYVDDELPDYIMVMVANKKTQNQMTDDLSLFLGLNTEKFTSWLHGLLVKLQTLSSEQQKGKEKQTEESRDEEETETTGKKSSPDKPEKLMKPPSEKNVGKKTAVKRKSSEGKPKMGFKESGSKTVDSNLLENESNSKPAPTSKLKDEEYVSELLESVETDEFSEEFIKEQEPRPVGTKAVKAVAPTTGTNVQTVLVAPQVTGSKVMIPTRDLSYPQQPKKKVVSKKVKTVIKRKADSGTARSGVPGSAKKKPSSIVGTVKQQFTELPDEEYDPLNPSFGKVASSVKVSRRRRLTIPPALQANKALILKATAEAEKSVSSTLQNVLKEEKLYSARGKALVRPVQRKVPELPELRHPKIRPNLELISKSKREEMMRNMTYTIANEESPESPESDEPENMKIVIQNKLKTGKVLQNANQEKVTYTVVNQPRKSQQEELVYSVDKRPSTRMQYISQAEPVQYAIRQMPQRVQVLPSGYVATSQSQNVQYLTQLPSGQMAYTDTTEPQFIQYVKVERQQMEMEPVQNSFQSDNRRIQHVARVQPVMDSRLVKRKSFEEEIKDEIDKEEEEETSDEEEEEAEMLPDVDDTDETSNEGQMVAGSSDAEGQEVIHDEVKEEEEEEEVEDVESLSLEGEEKTPEPSPEPVIEEQKPVPSKRLIRERQPKQSKPKPAQINPRFIVTLDGIDPSTFRTGSMFDEDTPKREIPVVSKITPPSITPIKFDLRDTDDEEEDLETNEESPSKKSKMTEKCKFWPACSAGNSCSYHHPSVSCKMFPNCKFADKCLYIHPNCKFDAKCTKKDCPFTHASKRGTGPTVIKQYIPMPVHTPPPYNNKPQGKIVCRFGVTCQNVYCPFQHPTNCRYGASCANIASCPFTHPAATQFTNPAATQFTHPAATKFRHPAVTQSKDKYSWTANKNLDNNNNHRKNQNHTTDFQRTHTVKFVPRLAVYDEQNLVLTIKNKCQKGRFQNNKDFNNNYSY
ncbi:zinc finger CCCH domain-containing protein 14-like isoform X4 [Mytilus edulis]|uniref:zinc finger CCCH domain-containing protein 14-like isoform X4 n=1 Tax=Mytilus edulis TaxID=6550 RepID=UPI0039F042F9